MATAHYSTEVPHHVCLTSSELHEANIVAVVELCEGIDKGEQPVRWGYNWQASHLRAAFEMRLDTSTKLVDAIRDCSGINEVRMKPEA